MKYPRPLLLTALILIAIWAVMQYLLPITLPFLVGAGLAAIAQPAVRFLEKKLRLPPLAASAISMSLLLFLIFAAFLMIFALLLRQAGLLTDILPELFSALLSGLNTLEDWLLTRAARMPGEFSVFLRDALNQIFSGSATVISRIGTTLLSFAGSFLSGLPNRALSIGTAILAAFMFCYKYPALQALAARPEAEKITGFFTDLRRCLRDYLRAQLALMGITDLILTLGLMLLRVPFAPIWAFLIAVVDAVPILGTGTVLLPWSFLCLLQGDTFRSVGLLIVYAGALIARTALEPKFLGARLGIDPLATLAALYVGFRLWGVAGLILSPLLAAVLVRSVDFFQQ